MLLDKSKLLDLCDEFFFLDFVYFDMERSLVKKYKTKYRERKPAICRSSKKHNRRIKKKKCLVILVLEVFKSYEGGEKQSKV